MVVSHVVILWGIDQCKNPAGTLLIVSWKSPGNLLSGYYSCSSTLIWLRFDYDNSYHNYDSTRQRKWPSGHHDSMLMKARIHTRRHFASEVCERAIPTSPIEGRYPMLIRQRECHSYYRDVHYYLIICPDHCLLIGYDACRATQRKNDHVLVES